MYIYSHNRLILIAVNHSSVYPLVLGEVAEMLVCVRGFFDTRASEISIHSPPAGQMKVNIFRLQVEQALTRPWIYPFCLVFEARVVADVEPLLVWAEDENVVDSDVRRVERDCKSGEIVDVGVEHIPEVPRCRVLQSLQRIPDRRTGLNLVEAVGSHILFRGIDDPEAVVGAVHNVDLPDDARILDGRGIERVGSWAEHGQRNSDDGDDNTGDPVPYR